MQTYKLAYDNVFLPQNFDQGIYYKNETILSVSIYMVFTALHKNKEEVNFKEQDLVEQNFQYAKGKFCAINDFYKCVIDENEGYKMILNEKLQNESDYTVTYEVGQCLKWEDWHNLKEIDHQEFIDILKTNFASFNHGDNKPAQSGSYYVVNILK